MKIHVGNLSQETTEPQLRESFAKFGEIKTVELIMDKNTGKPKGFAFVEMSTDDIGQQAIAGLHGQELAGNVLKVTVANSN